MIEPVVYLQDRNLQSAPSAFITLIKLAGSVASFILYGTKCVGKTLTVEALMQTGTPNNRHSRS